MILELDASSLTTRLRSRSQGGAYIDIILDDIRSLIPCLYSLMSSHVKRVGNSIAHLIARMCLLNGMKHIWCSDFSSSLTYRTRLLVINKIVLSLKKKVT